MNDFVKPTIEYPQLWPLLVIFGVACVGVLVEAFLPRENRYLAQVTLTIGGLAAALVGVVMVAGNLKSIGGVAHGSLAAEDTIAVDGPTVFLWGLLLVLAIAGALLFAERQLEGGVTAFAGQASTIPGSDAERLASAKGLEQTEVYPLLMFSVFGMMLFPAANDLLTLFVALEVMSLPLYLLCGLARRRRLLSQEAAMKYFLLGAFSTGFFLYGIALIYGFAGSMRFAAISEAVHNDVGNQSLLLIGLGMLSVGLLFKVSAAPFHAWTPDVYQGAPTPVTAFMAAGTKVAAFGAMLRLLYVAFGTDRWSWQPMLWIIAILTMIVGAVLAIAQTDVKRMLAYSSVAHSGFIITGVLGVQSATALADGQLTSLQAVLFYLTTYGFATLGAFAVVTLVRDSGGETTALSRWAGLGKESPLVAGMFAFFLLAMAGIPLTSGFVGKWAVFAVALAAGAWPVVVVAILTSVVAAFFYVRVIWLMYFHEPIGDGPAVTHPSVLTAATIGLTLGVTVLLGVRAGPDARSRRSCWRIHQVTTDPTSAGLALPVVDADLAARLTDRMARVEEELAGHVRSRAGFVTEAASHLMAAGGKRFRPLLVLLAAEAGAHPEVDEVVTAACVVELTHLASLYHDDVMDEAALRRGADSANARWDNHVAILTGDFLFSKSSELTAELGAEAVRIQAQTFTALVEGQILETVKPAPDEDPLAHYLDVVAGKTGSLIATSARYGAIFGGASPEIQQALTEYGEIVGSAFQLSDDILDIASESAESGKTPGTDLREGVPTLPVLMARASSDPADARLLELLDADLEDDALHAEALDLLRRHPAMDQARAYVVDQATQAKALLAVLPHGPVRDALDAFADLLAVRSS